MKSLLTLHCFVPQWLYMPHWSLKKSGYKSQSDMLFSYESFKGMYRVEIWILGVILIWLYLSNDLNSTKSSFKNSLTQRVADVCRV